MLNRNNAEYHTREFLFNRRYAKVHKPDFEFDEGVWKAIGEAHRQLVSGIPKGLGNTRDYIH